MGDASERQRVATNNRRRAVRQVGDQGSVLGVGDRPG